MSAPTTFTGGKNPWAIALTVTLATFMEVLDTSIANVSLPHIAGDLSVTPDQSTWVLTSYLVANAVVLPISGWLSTRFGRKRFYMTSVALFTVASLLAGIAPSLPALVVFRLLQGIGGGGLAPSEQAILADTFEPEKRGMAFAVYGVAVVLAPVIGPTLGGYITDHYSWRWIFFINVPVGILSLVLSNRMVQDPPYLKEMKSKAGSVDVVGIGLIAIGLGALEVVLDKGQEDDWFNSTFIIGFSIVTAVALIAFVVWELRTKNPIVDLRLFKDRSFAVSTAAMLTLGLVLYGSTVLIPQYLQLIMGYSSTSAGLALSPGAIATMMTMPIAGALVSKLDGRWLVAFGFTSTGVALLYAAHLISPGMDFSTAVWLRIYQSMGVAFLFIPINTIAYAGLPPEKSNSVSGVLNLFRNLGGDIGIALVTTLVSRRAQVHQATLTAHTSAFDPAFRRQLDALSHVFSSTQQALAAAYRLVQQQAAALAYVDTLFVIGCFAFVVLPLVFLMRKPDSAKGAAMAH
jgi:DHA2 family multidrug resistance protein